PPVRRAGGRSEPARTKGGLTARALRGDLHPIDLRPLELAARHRLGLGVMPAQVSEVVLVVVLADDLLDVPPDPPQRPQDTAQRLPGPPEAGGRRVRVLSHHFSRNPVLAGPGVSSGHRRWAR